MNKGESPMRVLTHTNLAGGNSCYQGKVKSTTSFGLGCEFDNSKFCFKIAEKRKIKRSKESQFIMDWQL